MRAYTVNTEYLRKKMAEHGIWTYNELARQAGVNINTFKMFRTGRFWSENVASKIEAYLNIKRRHLWIRER